MIRRFIMFGKNEELDFYKKTNLNAYDLTGSMRYQLNMLDNLDVFTRKHCENVANVSCRICEYMHLPKEFIVYCTICAYLHDIGKLFIPSKILQKQDRLTDEEYEIMKTHTTIGAKMCRNDLQLRKYIAGPLYHHEALDGSGYPEGLKGKDIPLEGKIIRVADTYDAIVSKRQYKSHVDITDTIKILIDDEKHGKISKPILKALIRVVIDDTAYEISCTYDYIKYLKDEIKRLELVEKYYNKYHRAKFKQNKDYYSEGVRMLLKTGETMDNCVTVLAEYRDALALRKDLLNRLFKELRQLKRLRIF